MVDLLESEILKKALEDGIIDLPTIIKQVEMKERKKYLNAHKSKIWESCGYWFTYLPKEEGSRLVKRKSREALEDVIVDFYKADKSVEPYINDVFYMWLSKKIEYGEITKNTMNRYINDYDRFIKNSIIDKRVSKITEEELEDFIKTSIQKHKLTSKAWGNLRTLLYGIFKYSKKHGYTKISIKQFVADIEISRKSFSHNKKKDNEQVFTDNEIKMICDKILNGNYGAGGYGIIFAFYTGMRSGEISALKWSDIDDDFIHVWKTEIRYNENGKTIYEVQEFPKTEAGIRTIVLTDECKFILEKLKGMNDSEYIFSNNGERLHAYIFTNKLRRICKSLNITPRSLHKCRKTFASKLINANVDENIIKNQLGHTNIETTRKYYFFNNRCEQDAMEMVKNALKV